VKKSETRTVLDAERQATLARIEAMTADFDEIVAASSDSNIDDEHDPEGSTVAFERAQIAALLAQDRVHLDDLDQALTRLAQGTYAVCESCGATIGSQRLVARPATRTCIACVGAPRSVRRSG
jgi:DnaK suppressor protein